MSVYGRKGALMFALYALACTVTLFFTSGKTAVIVISLVFSVISAIAVIKSKKKVAAVIFAVLCIVALLLGLLCGTLHAKKDISAKKYNDGKEHSVMAEITHAIYEKPFGSLYYARVTEVDGEKADFYIQLGFPYLPETEIHEKIGVTVVLSEPDDSEASLLKSKGVILCAEANDFNSFGGGGKYSLPEKINAFLADRFDKSIGGDEADFAGAIFLGNRERVSQKIKLAFRRSGTSHLLALSGLHLSVLAAGLEFSLKAVHVKKKIRIAVSIFATVAFAVVTGLSASVLRSAIMLVIYFAAQLAGEEKDSLTSLFASLALIITFRRYAVWDVGLWMSFSATLGLVLFSDRLLPHFAPMTRKTYSRTKKFFRSAVKYFLGLLSATAVATLFTLPVTYLLFGGVSLISPISNLVLVPLSQLLLYLLAMLCVLFRIPIVGTAIAFAAKQLTWLICYLAKLFASPSGVYISLKYPFTPYLIAAAMIFIAVIVFVPKINPRSIFAVLVGLCVAFTGCTAVTSRLTENDMFATAVNEKSSDALGIVYRGRSFVIDVSTGGFAVPYSAVTETSGYAACEMDVLILTHLHRYHAATLDRLCGYFKINKLLIPAAESVADSEIIMNILAIADENGVQTEFYNRRAESAVSCGDMKISLPEYTLLKRSKHPVISFSVYLGEKEVMLYSGAGAEEINDARIYSAALVFFGAHGPVRKKNIDTGKCLSAQSIIFSNKNVLAFAGKCDSPVLISDYGGKVTVKIK